MKLTSFSLAGIIFTFIFGGIALTSIMNWWRTETQKTPIVYTQGEAAGEYNPADIRGSYTFGEVSDLFDVPLVDLQIAFRIPSDLDAAGFQMKSMEALFGELPVEIGTESVRMFVAIYCGLPYDLDAADETYLFPEAVEILKSRAQTSSEEIDYLNEHIVPLTPDVSSEVTPPFTQNTEIEIIPKETEHVETERVVTGQTTFQDLINWGVEKAEIESVLGEVMPSPQVLIKDFANQKGLTFSTLKTQLQTVVDKAR